MLPGTNARLSLVQFCSYMDDGIYVKISQFQNSTVNYKSEWELKMVTICQKKLVHVQATYCSKTTRTA